MSQIQAIVNQSRVQGSREQDICPLCCLQVEGQPDSLPTDASGIDEFLSSEQPYCKSIPNKRSRRINTENFYTHIDHNNDSDLEMTSTYRDSKRTSASSSSRNTSVDTIGIHVAMHLQGIMLLTLRLISIDGAMDVLDEDQSAPGSTDNPSLSIRLGERSLSQDMHDIEDVSVNSGGEFGPDENPHSRHTVPDCEHIDWSVVPRRYEVPPDLEQSEIPFRPGPDLEVFISNYPLPRRITYEEDDLGQDLEEFISSPPMGALREQDYLGWELEEFISDGPEEELRDTKNLGEDVEDFISKGPN
ncbi:hypothetical protein N7528_007588 [Penicillium herquei]|nr:hypothetical protein N7528_007588 [Penicillium herquei]